MHDVWVFDGGVLHARSKRVSMHEEWVHARVKPDGGLRKGRDNLHQFKVVTTPMDIESVESHPSLSCPACLAPIETPPGKYTPIF